MMDLKESKQCWLTFELQDLKIKFVQSLW